MSKMVRIGKFNVQMRVIVAISIALAVIISVLFSTLITTRINAKTVEKTGYLQDVGDEVETALGKIAKEYLKEHNVSSIAELTDSQRQELGELLLNCIIEEYGDLDQDERKLIKDTIKVTIANSALEGKVNDAITKNIEDRGIHSGDKMDETVINSIIDEVTNNIYNSIKNETSMNEVTRNEVRSIASDVMKELVQSGVYLEKSRYENESAQTNATITTIQTNIMDSLKDIDTLRGAYDTLLSSSKEYQKTANAEMKELYQKIETYEKASNEADDSQSAETQAMYDQMMQQMNTMMKTFTTYQAEQKQIIDLINQTLAKKMDYGVADEAAKELAQNQKDAINESAKSIDEIISEIEKIQNNLSSIDENNNTIGLIKELKDAIASAQTNANSIVNTPVDNLTEAQVNEYSDKITSVENAERAYAAEIEKLVAKQKALTNYINILESNVDALSASLSANYQALSEQEVKDIQNQITSLNGKITSLKSYSNDISDVRVALTELQNTNANIKSNVDKSGNQSLIDAIAGIDRRISALSDDMKEAAEDSSEGDAAIQTAKDKLTTGSKDIKDAGDAQSDFASLGLSDNPTMVDVIQKFYSITRNEDAKIEYNSGLITDLQEQMAYVKAWESRIVTLEEQVNVLASTYATAEDLEDLKNQVQGDIKTSIDQMQDAFASYQGVTSDKLAEMQEVDKQLNRRIDAIKDILGLIKTNIAELDARDFYIGPFTVNSDDYTINDPHIKADSDIMIDYDLSTLPSTSIGFTYDQGDGYIVIHGANGSVIKKIHIQNEVVLTQWDNTVPDYTLPSEQTNTESATTPDNNTTSNDNTSDTENTNTENTNTNTENTNTNTENVNPEQNTASENTSNTNEG